MASQLDRGPIRLPAARRGLDKFRYVPWTAVDEHHRRRPERADRTSTDAAR